jgi:hypothetical protein
VCRDRADQFCELSVTLSASYGTKPGQNPQALPPWGTLALQPGPRFQQIGDGDGGKSPIPEQIGDGDGGASPPPGKSGTDAPPPSPDKSGTGKGTGTGVSAPWLKPDGVLVVYWKLRRAALLLRCFPSVRLPT